MTLMLCIGRSGQFEPVQTAARVASHKQSSLRQPAQTPYRGIEVEPGDLRTGRCVPQADGSIVSPRGKTAVGQNRKGADLTPMPLEPGGLGAGRRVPQADGFITNP